MQGSNSLNPDQARHFVGPDLGPNSLQRLSEDDSYSRNLQYAYHCLCENLILLHVYKKVQTSLLLSTV